MAVYALVPAAGMGKRMGASINKQYLLLDGKPILARTLEVFEGSPIVDGVFVVIPADEIPYCRREVVESHGLNKVRAIVAGGAERQHSVLNGLRAMDGMAGDDDVVLIHDGVRPFVTEEIIIQAATVAREEDGALVAVPAKDTVKVVKDGIIAETPRRQSLWLAQTPQAFRYRIIRAAHERAEAEGFLGTDDSMLVERMGGRVRIVQGDYRNFKITTPEDMVLAEAFIRERQK